MYTTDEFREQVYLWYSENGITVGDPSVGRWEHAHIVPRCCGGTETTLLLYGHHIIHDIIQSSEYNRQCFWTGGTRTWLYGEGFLCENWFELVSLYEYYSAANGTQNCTRQFEGMTPEQLSAEMSRRRRAGWAAMTQEQRSEEMTRRSRVGWASMTPVDRSAQVRRTRWANPSPEDKAAFSATMRKVWVDRKAKVRAERALRSLGDELHGALWADDTL